MLRPPAQGGGDTMEYVLLSYGAAFVATGFALALQARTAEADAALPGPALSLAAAFALVHGASEWLQLSVFLEQREHGVIFVRVEVARLALLAASYAILGAFGLLLGSRTGRGLSVAVVPAAALAAWVVVTAIARPPARPDEFAGVEAATRYLLGVPASAVALVGLDRARRRLEAEEWRTARFVQVATVALGAYGFFTGLVVPRTSVQISRVLNVQTFASTIHVPVELFRAGSIAAVGFLLSEAFVRTTTGRLRADVEHLRDGFISLVAHDLRTPLGTVETGVTLLERLPRGEHASEREERVVRAIRASVRTMGKIVSDLLDASRIESRRLSVSRERLEVAPLLLRMIEWAPAEALRGHEIRLVPPAPLPAVFADPVRVEQVLTNLLTNAGKYSPPGSEIVVEALAGAEEITISVTNAGQGIPERDLDRIFTRHYRTNTAERGRAPGLGLGLYIARGLVEANGGQIWAESEVGRSTTFRFTLPLAGAPAHGEASPSPSAAPGASRAQRG